MPVAKLIQNGTGIAYWTPDWSLTPFNVGLSAIPALATGTVDVTFENINAQDVNGTAAASATWYTVVSTIGTGTATANFTTPVQAFRINVTTSTATGVFVVNFVQAGLAKN